MESWTAVSVRDGPAPVRDGTATRLPRARASQGFQTAIAVPISLTIADWLASPTSQSTRLGPCCQRSVNRDAASSSVLGNEGAAPCARPGF